MASGSVHDATPMSVGPLELPHAARLLGPQRDSILSDTGIICHVSDRHGPDDVMFLLMQGPKVAGFEKARVRVVEYVNSNFEKGVRNHNDARAKGLLAPQYGGEGANLKNFKFRPTSEMLLRQTNTKKL